MSDIKITVGADIKNLQTELAKAGGVTQDFANKTVTANKTVGASYQSMFNLTEKLRGLQSAVFTEKDRGKISLYNAEIKKTEIELAKLNSIGVASGNGIAQGAGKAFSALRNLAYLLPGIGIAGILGFAVEPIVNYISAITGASKAVKELNDRREKFDNEAASNYGKEITSLQFLREAIENTSLPMAKRLQAIKDLKKEFPGLFDGLTNEQLLTGNVANAYDLATQAILRKARATAALTQLEKIAAEQLKILEKNQKDVVKTTAELSKAQDKVINNAAIGPIGSIGKTRVDIQRELVAQYNFRRKIAQDEFDALKKEQDFYLKIAAEGADRVIEIEKAKKAKLEKFKNIPQLPDVISDFQIKPTRTTGTAAPTIVVRPEFVVDHDSERRINEKLEDFLKRIKLQKFQEDATKAINATLSNILNDTISNVAEGVTDILTSGQDAVPRLFDNIMKGIGGQVKELGKYLVKVGVEMLAAKKAIKALGLTPQTAIIAGFALEILGALLTSAATKKANQTGFASGGTVGQSGIYNVGERGQERIFLPQGAKVQPNNEVMAYGGGGMVFIPSITLQGPDLVIAFNRASAAMGRNN